MKTQQNMEYNVGDLVACTTLNGGYIFGLIVSGASPEYRIQWSDKSSPQDIAPSQLFFLKLNVDDIRKSTIW
jgi:hypothetical protein